MTFSALNFAWMLRDARRQTLELIADLSAEQLIGPRLDTVNPLHWELGHIAWFQERWMLRRAPCTPSIWIHADATYDSAKIPHRMRWDLQLPSREDTLGYAHDVLDRALEQVAASRFSDEEAYFCLLAILHEDMHCEAFVHTRQTLGYPAPRVASFVQREETKFSVANTSVADAPLPGDVEFLGGRLMLGSQSQAEFIFDNEKWAHPVDVRPFRMARAPVTNADFAEFVEADGYQRRELWSVVGWRWRQQADARQPIYWQRQAGGRWLLRQYDQFLPLRGHLPIIHVNWFEADAYCRWAGRRLPSEAEWEFAAATGLSPDAKRVYPWGDEVPTPRYANLDLRSVGCVAVNQHEAGDSAAGCRQMIGNVWEWTASDFEPYPGFSADPYKEYSQPWFGGTHKVLRGGAFPTRSRMIRSAYRNFYTPERRDVLAGFRTAAIADCIS